MAKLSSINKNNKRIKLSNKFYKKKLENPKSAKNRDTCENYEKLLLGS